MHLFLAFIFLSTPSSAETSPLWISMDQSDYASLQSVQKSHFPEGPYGDTEQHGQRILFELAWEDLPAFSAEVRRSLGRHGGFVAHRSRQEALKSLKQIDIKAFKQRDYILDQGDLVQAFLSELAEPTIRATIESLSEFVNRYYIHPGGVESAEWLYAEWAQFALQTQDGYVSYINHQGFDQPSVMFTLPGVTDDNSSVILGGHLDSTTSGTVLAHTRAPGADDNASGIACLTELIRTMVKLNYRPQTTVHIIAYAAEEVGLLGSGDIASHFANESQNVLGVLQLDMTNFWGSAVDVTFISDYTDANQNDFLMDLIDTYLDLTYQSSPCGYGCSDHASWTQHGYPASFPFEAPIGQHNPYIHSADDTLENCGDQTEKALDFTQLAAAFLVELAKGQLTAPTSPPGVAKRWIPHVTRSNGGFETRFIVQNQGQTATIDLFGYNEDGDLIQSQTVQIDEMSYSVLTREDLWNTEVSHFSIFGPESVRMIAAIAPSHGQGASAHIPESGLYSNNVSFFIGEWETVFDGMALINTEDHELDITVRLDARAVDQPTQIETFSLEPKAKLLLDISNHFLAQDADSRLTIEANGSFAITVLRGTAPNHVPGFLYQTLPLP